MMQHANVYSILKHKQLVITLDGLEALGKRLQVSKVSSRFFLVHSNRDSVDTIIGLFWMSLWSYNHAHGVTVTIMHMG